MTTAPAQTFKREWVEALNAWWFDDVGSQPDANAPMEILTALHKVGALRVGETKEWRCFWCDECFTDEDEAREHFGTQEGEPCACKLTKDEKGLVGLLRDAWKRLDEFYSENDAQTKLFYSLGATHSTALREAEQSGYDKGLADGRTLPAPLAPVAAQKEEAGE